MTVDTERYVDFVREVTSNESVHYAALLTRMNNLELEDCLLYTSPSPRD